MNPRFEGGITDFMDGFPDFMDDFNVLHSHRKLHWRNQVKSLNSMPESVSEFRRNTDFIQF